MTRTMGWLLLGFAIIMFLCIVALNASAQPVDQFGRPTPVQVDQFGRVVQPVPVQRYSGSPTTCSWVGINWTCQTGSQFRRCRQVGTQWMCD